MKIEVVASDGASVTLPSVISNQQDASEQQSYTRLTVMLPVNGRDYRVSVAAVSPSTDARSRTTSKSRVSNKPVTTAPTRTRSTTKKATSTGSATDATTAGTRRTTRTTSRTNAGQETKKKRGAPPKTDRNNQLVKMHNDGYSLSQLAEQFGITRSRVQQIYRKYS